MPPAPPPGPAAALGGLVCSLLGHPPGRVLAVAGNNGHVVHVCARCGQRVP